MVMQSDDNRVDDDQLITWWGLVIEGYTATQVQLTTEIAERFDLAPASLDIVLRLLRSPDTRLPMTKLAGEAALSSGGFTKVADRLVAAGLIRREPSWTDRRVTYAVLTEYGRGVADQARRACAEILRRIVLDPLGADRSSGLAEIMRTLRHANASEADDANGTNSA